MNTSGKNRFAIIGNEYENDHAHWVSACSKFPDKLIFKVVNLVSPDWLEEINEFQPHLCLLKPSGTTSLYRDLYQERVDILVHDMGYPVFPSFDELRIYENKRFFSYWALANGIPHPPTWVLYNKKEANGLLRKNMLPLVGKMNVGASGKGIRFLKTKPEYKRYINKAFTRGISSSSGPKLRKGHLLQRTLSKLIHPKEILILLKRYKDIARDKQKGFVILQQYIPHDFEWRAVRIGNSFFAHKKISQRGKASGSLKKGYENPPIELMEFVRELTEKHNFYSVAIDLFEIQPAEYLVNEIQCIFGQSDSFQMMVDGRIGRYRYFEGKWIFDEGDFNSNESYDLRVEYALSMLEE